MSFETQYLVFGGFVISAGIAMILTYTLTNPWWRTHLGQMLIVYAVAEVAMSALLMSAVVWHFSPHWFRGVWFGLQTVVGGTFWFQTAVLIRIRRERVRRGRRAQHTKNGQLT